MSSVKVKCTCKHEYQDEKYGNGTRIACLTYSKKDARCTVCQKLIAVKSEK